MLLGQRLQIIPNKKQKAIFEKAFGIKRYTYNWALNKWKSLKAQGVRSVNMNTLKKEWNHTKPIWVYEAPKDANQQPFTDLKKALSNYFYSKKKGLHTFHFPKFKTKNKSKNSFYISNTYIHLNNNFVHIPKAGKMPIIGHLQYHLKDIKIMSYTISKTADKYYLSINYDVPDNLLHKQKLNLNIVGIDVGRVQLK